MRRAVLSTEATEQNGIVDWEIRSWCFRNNFKRMWRQSVG